MPMWSGDSVAYVALWPIHSDRCLPFWTFTSTTILIDKANIPPKSKPNDKGCLELHDGCGVPQVDWRMFKLILMRGDD